MKSLWTSLLTVALVALTWLPAMATPVVQHVGSTDPVTESWTKNGGQPVGAVNDGGTLAWQTADNSLADLAYYRYHLNTVNFASGWIYTVRDRVVNAPGYTIAFAAQDNTDYFSIWQRADGLYYFNNSSVFTPLYSMNTTDSYHTYQIVDNPLVGDRVGVYVDGVWRVNIFRSDVPSVGLPNVWFGAGKSGGEGTANWEYVSFATGVPLPSAWILLGSGLLGLVGLRRKRRP